MMVAGHVLDRQQLSGLVMVLQLKFEPAINYKENIYIIICYICPKKQLTMQSRFDHIHAFHENQTYDSSMASAICSTHKFKE